MLWWCTTFLRYQLLKSNRLSNHRFEQRVQPIFCIKSASGIRKALYRSWAYRDIAVAQAEAGHITDALDTARRVEDPEDRDQALAAIEKHKKQKSA